MQLQCLQDFQGKTAFTMVYSPDYAGEKYVCIRYGPYTTAPIISVARRSIETIVWEIFDSD